MAQYCVIKSYTRQYEEPIRFAQSEAIVRERKDDEYLGWWWCSDILNGIGEIGGWLLATAPTSEQGWLPLSSLAMITPD